MPTAPSTLAQAQRIQNALSVLGPQDTISLLRLLKRADGTLPKPELEAKSLWMSETQIDARLEAMEEGGLITRKREAGGSLVSLTRSGSEALYIQIPVTHWASAHQSVPERGTGLGAYTEQALATLNKTHTVATIMALAAYGEPAYPSEIVDTALPAGMVAGNLYQRLAQLEKDGLVERTGTPRNYTYGLTRAGKALSEPLEAIGRWAQRHLPPPPPRASVTTRRTNARSATAAPAPQLAAIATPAPRTAPLATPALAPVAAATGAPSPSAQAASRTKAATIRSVSTALTFSHQSAPQPAPLITNSPAAKRH
ncbi:winged helix-turn-helix transcriptional regulator [Kitasatospora aureofaciens]|uniref:winged helix-turn-helix transcriptional regulator n=1 Tax=Kitasatospora aureofaciens TaxID=1894 RepID=UPI001C47E528|nr:winged helix-turn-helix transcriptional regulator [Kitasatospora aureofaciens]MBV6695564.1 winged helix-turn-helix transcriptional regulator [Kitasatospora aureofaciens]